MPSKTHTYPARHTQTHHRGINRTCDMLFRVPALARIAGTWFFTGLTAPWSRQSQLLGAGSLEGVAGFIGLWRVHWLRRGFRYVERNSSSKKEKVKKQKERTLFKEMFLEGSPWRHADWKLHILIWNGASTYAHAPVRSLNLVTPYSAEPWSRDWSFSAVFRFSWKICKRRFVSAGILKKWFRTLTPASFLFSQTTSQSLSIPHRSSNLCFWLTEPK